MSDKIIKARAHLSSVPVVRLMLPIFYVIVVCGKRQDYISGLSKDDIHQKQKTLKLCFGVLGR